MNCSVILAAIAVGLLVAGAVWVYLPETINGPAYVLDGDTVIVANTRVRLNGVDAPEVSHKRRPYRASAYADGKRGDPWGVEAKHALAVIINNRAIICRLDGSSAGPGRRAGVCRTPDGVDIGAELIRQGLALDCQRYSGGRYRLLEPTDARQRLIQAPYC